MLKLSPFGYIYICHCELVAACCRRRNSRPGCPHCHIDIICFFLCLFRFLPKQLQVLRTTHWDSHHIAPSSPGIDAFCLFTHRHLVPDESAAGEAGDARQLSVREEVGPGPSDGGSGSWKATGESHQRSWWFSTSWLGRRFIVIREAMQCMRCHEQAPMGKQDTE